jgi:hypothetical protein
MKILYRRKDGSFVAEVNGLPYHITKESNLFSAAESAGADAPYEPEPAPPTKEDEAKHARRQRNLFLQQSDWTQVADAPVDQAAWATYRQALRDVTAQAGFPEIINWPIAPE